jgi:uncharacterized membrane protein
VRLITAPVSYERLVERAYEKIRQAAGMPAVLIRQLDALTQIGHSARRPERLPVLLDQAEMIWRLAGPTVSEPADLAAVDEAYQGALAALRPRRAPWPGGGRLIRA